MMRKFAWCGTHRSMSSSPTPAALQTSVAWRMKMSTANLKTSGPTISMNGIGSFAAYAPFSMLPQVTCAYPRPSEPRHQLRKPAPLGAARTTAAPAPSPKMTAVPRLV